MTPPIPLFLDILLPGHPVIQLPIAGTVLTPGHGPRRRK